MRLSITPTDMKRSKIVKPGWHVLEIVSNKAEANKAGDAMNEVVDFVGVSPDVEGVPFRIWISEKAAAIQGVPLLKALGFTIDENEGIQVDFEENQLKGRKVKALISTGKYNGKPQNQLDDFAAV